MVNFQIDPVIFSAIGGIILGISTSLNYMVRGKVTGMSGIVYGIVSVNKKQLPQKLTLVGGMMFIASIFYLIFGQGNYSGFQPFGPQSNIDIWTTYPGYVLAGFFVGFGTKLSNGCTSGHGLCGMARLSIRSIVAVSTFLLVALGIGTLSYQIDGLGPFSTNNPTSPLNPEYEFTYNHTISSIVFLIIGLILPFIGFIIKKRSTQKENFYKKLEIIDHLIVFAVGLIFSIGLMMSGMTRRINILEFLWIGNRWNPQLLFVLGFGLAFNVLSFQYMIRSRKAPFLGQELFNPQNNKIDFKLVFGAFIFGLGWGIGGLCPGPWIVLFPTFTIGVSLIWGCSLIIGQLCAAKLGDYIDAKQKQRKQKQKYQEQSSRKELIRQDLSLQAK